MDECAPPAISVFFASFSPGGRVFAGGLLTSTHVRMGVRGHECVYVCVCV